MSHHSNEPSSEILKHLREVMGSHADQLGPTGRYPEGKMVKEDQGELAFAVGHHKGKVFMEFGKPIDWLGMNPRQAVELANHLIKWARQAQKHPGSPQESEPITVEL